MPQNVSTLLPGERRERPGDLMAQAQWFDKLTTTSSVEWQEIKSKSVSAR